MSVEKKIRNNQTTSKPGNSEASRVGGKLSLINFVDSQKEIDKLTEQEKDFLCEFLQLRQMRSSGQITEQEFIEKGRDLFDSNQEIFDKEAVKVVLQKIREKTEVSKDYLKPKVRR